MPTIVFDPTNQFTGGGTGTTGGSTGGGTTLGNLAPAAGGNFGDLSPSAGGDMLGEFSPSAGGIGANIITCVNNLLQRDWDNPSASYDCNTATN